MKTYKEKMLVLLVEKYRKSKKDNGTNVIFRRTSISPVELYKKYNKNDGELEEIEAINQAAEVCSRDGFLTFKKKISKKETEIQYPNLFLTSHFFAYGIDYFLVFIDEAIENFFNHIPFSI